MSQGTVLALAAGVLGVLGLRSKHVTTTDRNDMNHAQAAIDSSEALMPQLVADDIWAMLAEALLEAHANWEAVGDAALEVGNRLPLDAREGILAAYDAAGETMWRRWASLRAYITTLI